MLILASKSPRRRELLELAELEYICIPSDADEEIPEGMPASRVAEYLAEKKAAAVLELHPEDTVLGSDTVVVQGDVILGKPADPEDAFRMLNSLSGGTHTVYTGVAVLSAGQKRVFTSETQVEFYPLTEQEIRHYIASGEPMDKAGAYGIQGKGALLVKEIRGDYYTVMGLPIAQVVRSLRDMEGSV